MNVERSVCPSALCEFQHALHRGGHCRRAASARPARRGDVDSSSESGFDQAQRSTLLLRALFLVRDTGDQPNIDLTESAERRVEGCIG